MQYCVSADMIHYIMSISHKYKLYGVQNMLSAMTQRQQQERYEQVQMDMLTRGYGEMDFDGVFTVTDQLSQLIGQCCDCSEVICAALRRGKKTLTWTAYICETGIHVIEQVGLAEYVLWENAVLDEQVLSFLKLPKTTVSYPETCIDTALIVRRDLEGIKAEGCPDALANLVVNACAGIDGYGQISLFVDDIQKELVTLLFNDSSMVRVEVEYTWGQELFKLCSVTAQWVADKTTQMGKVGVL